MLHYLGDIEAHELGYQAKSYIFMYEKDGQDVCLVPYRDLEKRKKRFVKFEKMLSQWVFVDLVD